MCTFLGNHVGELNCGHIRMGHWVCSTSLAPPNLTVNPITVIYHLICTDALVLTQLSSAVVCVNVCVCVYMFTMHVR